MIIIQLEREMTVLDKVSFVFNDQRFEDAQSFSSGPTFIQLKLIIHYNKEIGITV